MMSGSNVVRSASFRNTRSTVRRGEKAAVLFNPVGVTPRQRFEIGLGASRVLVEQTRVRRLKQCCNGPLKDVQSPYRSFKPPKVRDAHVQVRDHLRIDTELTSCRIDWPS